MRAGRRGGRPSRDDGRRRAGRRVGGRSGAHVLRAWFGDRRSRARAGAGDGAGARSLFGESTGCCRSTPGGIGDALSTCAPTADVGLVYETALGVGRASCPAMPCTARTSRSRPSRLLRFIEHAEQAGFEGGMSSDHFAPWSERQGESGFAWSFLGAALARTSLPFGVVNAPGQRYHPAIIAQAAATLCEMFPERLWIALGLRRGVQRAHHRRRLAAQGDPQRAAARVRGHHAGAVRGRGGLARRARGRRPRAAVDAAGDAAAAAVRGGERADRALGRRVGRRAGDGQRAGRDAAAAARRVRARRAGACCRCTSRGRRPRRRRCGSPTTSGARTSSTRRCAGTSTRPRRSTRRPRSCGRRTCAARC